MRSVLRDSLRNAVPQARRGSTTCCARCLHSQWSVSLLNVSLAGEQAVVCMNDVRHDLAHLVNGLIQAAVNIARVLAQCREICFYEDGYECQKYLEADLSLPCNGEQYDSMQRWALAMAIVYFCLAPASLLLLLYRIRCKAHKASTPRSPFDVGFAYLTEAYRDDTWWYDIYELLRKMLLVSVVMLVSHEGSTQLALATVLAVSALLTHTYIKPSFHAKDWWIETWQQAISLTSQVSILIVGANLRAQQLEDDSDLRDEDNRIGSLLIGITVATWLSLPALIMFHRTCKKGNGGTTNDEDKGTILNRRSSQPYDDDDYDDEMLELSAINDDGGSACASAV
eukprot:TRINITY_DN1795_c0_g1_i1.p1 TRINITY_DN1795_c0_g1~~TRINITY_DN1795_c0_g1_i1.p1  ORF type:complete len:340 (+),score=60.40 TRINITY_DN1795_c0_g1_i1:864-1883(+)